MASERGRSLVRIVSILDALRSARRGLTIAQLIERTGGSRASIYRDLKVLRAANLPIDKVPVAGEMRYVLPGGTDGAYALTPAQLAALLTGRRLLSPLEGTRLVREFDVLLRQSRAQLPAPQHVHVPRSHTFAPDKMSIIDRALDQRRCLRLRYRGTKDAAPSWRLVEPVELRVSSHQPYLVAYDQSQKRFKTYKLSRISQVQPVNERARAREHYKPDTEFEHSRGIWSGPAHDVAVRIDKDVARFIAEWPLHAAQSITDQPNGDIIVRARIAGLHEVLRWVLSWGRNAEALEPDELRRMVADELQAAANRYRGRDRWDRRGVSGVETGVD